MKMDIEKQLERLVKKEGLQNLDLYYYDYHDFEEIPLYSRFHHISFLSPLSFNEKNKVLIKKGVELVSIAIDNVSKFLNESELREHFICLTVSDWDDYQEINCLLINIFISRKKNWILSQLKLKETSSIEENLIREYLFSLNLEGYKVYVPHSNEIHKRVYIVKTIIE